AHSQSHSYLRNFPAPLGSGLPLSTGASRAVRELWGHHTPGQDPGRPSHATMGHNPGTFQQMRETRHSPTFGPVSGRRSPVPRTACLDSGSESHVSFRTAALLTLLTSMTVLALVVGGGVSGLTSQLVGAASDDDAGLVATLYDPYDSELLAPYARLRTALAAGDPDELLAVATE